MNTNVRIDKVFEDKGNLKAAVSASFDDSFVVTGLRLMDSEKGMFLAMPSRKSQSGKYYDTAFPLTKEMRQELTDKAIEAYEQKLEETESQDFEEAESEGMTMGGM